MRGATIYTRHTMAAPHTRSGGGIAIRNLRARLDQRSNVISLGEAGLVPPAGLAIHLSP